ncbi:MAG: heat-inducible transcription repressor HrcA [Lachnospiraceae bacterium]|nr:heat-inducible transcription repressor HrcA [Lachnospiraceae bacterium]MBR6401512.1 heat-inducible transcription repressor HrcA [Bacillota bacterium]
MDLNDRKFKILEAIITDYIKTAEPIGSRTIAKKYDLGVSSATIRNDMSDLEELGLIVQPHTSAGRIPSDRGYRLYVDKMMQSQELSPEVADLLHNVVENNIGQIDYLMQQTAKALAALTNYTIVVTEPKSQKLSIKHVQLVPVDERSVVAVIVTENKSVKNHLLRVGSVPDIEQLNNISQAINAAIQNYSLQDMESIASAMLQAHPENRELVTKLLKAILTAVKQNDNVHYYTSGVNNILGFPEFSDVEKAKSIFRALEEKDMLITLFDKNGEHNDEVHIVIGGENNMKELQDCSIVRADYSYGNDSYGTIGVIGPTRMNYSQTVSVLSAIIKNLETVIKSISDGKNKEGKNG